MELVGGRGDWEGNSRLDLSTIQSVRGGGQLNHPSSLPRVNFRPEEETKYPQNKRLTLSLSVSAPHEDSDD